MGRATPATQALDRAGVAYAKHTYTFDASAEQVGLHAARSLGADPSIVLKTLMTLVDDDIVCVIVRSDREVSMKRLATALRARTARMLDATVAERVTGYRVGGISPFGQKRRSPVLLDEDALRHPAVFVNGGQRGLQLKLHPKDILVATQAQVFSLT